MKVRDLWKQESGFRIREGGSRSKETSEQSWELGQCPALQPKLEDKSFIWHKYGKNSYTRHFPRTVLSFLVTISGHGCLFSRNLSKEDRIEMSNVMEHTFASNGPVDELLTPSTPEGHSVHRHGDENPSAYKSPCFQSLPFPPFLQESQGCWDRND